MKVCSRYHNYLHSNHVSICFHWALTTTIIAFKHICSNQFTFKWISDRRRGGGHLVIGGERSKVVGSEGWRVGGTGVIRGYQGQRVPSGEAGSRGWGGPTEARRSRRVAIGCRGASGKVEAMGMESRGRTVKQQGRVAGSECTDLEGAGSLVAGSKGAGSPMVGQRWRWMGSGACTLPMLGRF
jgi:hypothetical protein